MSGPWRVFLGYPGPTRARVEAVYDALPPSVRAVTFLDARSVAGGEGWAEEIRAAMAEAALIVLFVPQATDEHWYLREEIAMAVRQRRARGAALLPVWLDGEGPKPYGLEQVVFAAYDTPAGVAGRIVRRLERGDDPPGLQEPPRVAWAVGVAALGALAALGAWWWFRDAGGAEPAGTPPAPLAAGAAASPATNVVAPAAGAAPPVAPAPAALRSEVAVGSAQPGGAPPDDGAAEAAEASPAWTVEALRTATGEEITTSPPPATSGGGGASPVPAAQIYVLAGPRVEAGTLLRSVSAGTPWVCQVLSPPEPGAVRCSRSGAEPGGNPPPGTRFEARP